MTVKIGKLRLVVAFPVVALATYMLSTEMCGNYIAAVGFASVHEAGHIIAMLMFGCKIQKLTFGAMGIKISKNATSLSFRQEFVTALCGPAVNLMLAVIFYLVGVKTLFYVNVGLFAVNMLPLRILDGGRALYYLCLEKSADNADKIMTTAETVTLVMLVSVMIFSVVYGKVNTTFVFFTLASAVIVCLNACNCRIKYV